MQTAIAVHRVLRQHFVVKMLCCLYLGVASFGIAYAADAESQKSDEKAEPLTLDLSGFYLEPNASLTDIKSLSGRQVIDNLPFQIDGQVRLYGKCEESYSDTKKGIRIGRKFDELYLIHHTTWPDAEGQTIAYICLNYADGTEYIFPVRYGYHVRDWFNLPSYEKETMADSNTTVCWRHPPIVLKAPVRIFKSKFVNPMPEKIVVTMDIVSGRNLAAYSLLAATVANHRSADVPNLTGDRQFDGKIAIRVVDDITGKPIAGALVRPGLNVLDEGVVGSPFYTSSTGEGIIPYPIKDTANISASVQKEGYKYDGIGWSSAIPNTYTFRLKPLTAEDQLDH